MVSARFCSFIQTASHWNAHWATIFAEMGLFSFTTLLLGRFGSEVVAAHNISMNINGVLFMPPMALGMAQPFALATESVKANCSMREKLRSLPWEERS